MKRTKLKNAPLKEAIFELFWDLSLDKNGLPYDKEFDLAQGKFESGISKLFPIHKRLIPINSPIRVYGKPAHQFWKGELIWPVIQLGPGVMSVNDTEKNYDWIKNYRNNIIESIKILLSSYKEELKFSKLTLKYIDSVDLPDDSKLSPINFVGKNFKTDIINKFDLPGELVGLNVNQVFKVTDRSQVSLNLLTAVNNTNGKPALVWITTIEKRGKFNEHEIYDWVDKAHELCSDLFVNILNNEFYESFDR